MTLDLAPPPAGPDAPYELHLAVSPGLPILEVDAADNNRTLAAGGLPAPPLPWAQVKPGSALVFPERDAVANRRMAGYRVYWASAGNVYQPIGSSFTPGYVDLTAAVRAAYTYAVAAYTADGLESLLSQGVNVTVPPLRTYLPLVWR